MFTAENSGNHKRTSKSVSKPVNENQDKWLLDPGILMLAAGVLIPLVLLVISLMFPAEAESSMLPEAPSSAATL